MYSSVLLFVCCRYRRYFLLVIGGSHIWLYFPDCVQCNVVRSGSYMVSGKKVFLMMWLPESRTHWDFHVGGASPLCNALIWEGGVSRS